MLSLEAVLIFVQKLFWRWLKPNKNLTDFKNSNQDTALSTKTPSCRGATLYSSFSVTYIVEQQCELRIFIKLRRQKLRKWSENVCKRSVGAMSSKFASRFTPISSITWTKLIFLCLDSLRINFVYLNFPTARELKKFHSSPSVMLNLLQPNQNLSAQFSLKFVVFTSRNFFF